MTLAAAVMSMLALASVAGAAVVYDNIATPQASNVASLGYEATSTSEWGNQVILAGTARKDPKVTVLMSSWGCQAGGGPTCVTAPGATFTLPITLKLYTVNANNTPGQAIATDTQTFAIPFRPTADPTCPGGAWRDAKGTCFNGFATPITFNLSGEGITLPGKVIVTVAYNTTSHGYRPIGTQSCGANCGYDSLNVGAETAGPTVGSIPAALAKDTYWATTFGGFYCDGGAGGTGTLRIDDCSATVLPAENWIENQPSFRISASDTEGSAGPTGAAGSTGAAGTAGAKGANAESLALKRKMSLSFPKATASVSGGKALVLVRCNGSIAQRCVGTLTVNVAGQAHKAVYTVPKAKKATLEVPLGTSSLSLEGGASLTAHAVARTEQPAGRPFRTSRKLRLG